ncbi:MAG: CoA-binding protein [Rhodocyclaceae bacterium]|nr:CoA-binding protein [Rhodocyclaceae bacterium]MBK6554630.1 CoA-binding protein [Rhodocyclaceae bacterium]MBK6677435.1 CoA-binding protein [Rhodocyclaceae bacterium]MBK9310091.1 CoA-binding protein [Rhodocyclaceae bacterium]MBK9954835.1 CoA-binding protein [Rhodocyclaceae bacterium]
MSLDSLFKPRSIAVYGASATDSRKLGNTLLSNAANGAGDVVAVHPDAAAIDGIPAVAKLDRRIDLALISVPDKRVEAAVADAAAAGAGAAIVLSSGFGETGAAGRVVQDRLVTIARSAGMRLVGPNCMGVVSHLGGDRWLNGSYFWRIPNTAGGLSFVSQSGAFGGMFFAHMRASGLGLSRFLSVGNSADIGITDALEWLGDDAQTSAIGMFVEGIGDGRRFVDVARTITPRKPVVVLKAGKMAAGAKAAASHTGSMAGSHAAIRAGLRRAGVIEAADTEAFFDAMDAAAVGLRKKPARNIAIVTISGGPSVLAADAAERAGLALPTLGRATIDRLRGLVPAFAALGNPIDLTPQCPIDNFIPAIEAIYADAAIEGIVAINCGLDMKPFGTGVARGVAATGKPTAAFVLDAPGVEAEMAGAGVLRFASPERAVNALASGA